MICGGSEAQRLGLRPDETSRNNDQLDSNNNNQAIRVVVKVILKE